MNKKVNEAILGTVLEKLDKKDININTASILLGITKRQIYKIKNKIKLHDSPKPKIKPPKNKTPEELERQIVSLYKGKYNGLSHTHFYEKLITIEKIDINSRTMSRILNSHNLISPLAQKKTKRKLREKLKNKEIDNLTKEQIENINDRLITDSSKIHNRYHHIEDFGAILQLDARSDYFIKKEKWSLHLCIDVGSRTFVGAYFDKEETLNGYQHVLHQVCTKYGIPKNILTDNRTVFEYLSKNSKAESKNTLIQFKFSCINLGINLQTTSVATFKSIIERANGTFGRRLPQELKLNKIKAIEEANIFLNSYIKIMNDMFAKPINDKNVFRKAPDLTTLNNLIGVVSRRIFDNACCIKKDNEYYYATIDNKIVAFQNKTKCLFIKTFDGRFLISVDSISYVAMKVSDMKAYYEKESNPNAYTFLSNHKVSNKDFVNYNLKNKSIWNYNNFEKYIEDEMYLIENHYYKK